MNLCSFAALLNCVCMCGVVRSLEMVKLSFLMCLFDVLAQTLSLNLKCSFSFDNQHNEANMLHF